jgi:hypothetical protein
MDEYPHRPQFFALRYIRILAKTCAAQDIGSLAHAICTTIVSVEDSARYKKPITFFNEQLMPIVGVKKWDQFDKARKLAIEHGWLHYECQGKRKPGIYWVTIPAIFDDDSGHFAGEGESLLYPVDGINQGINQGIKKGQTGVQRGDELGEPPILVLSPSTDTSPSPKKARSKAAVIVEIPESLQTGGFPEKWDEWKKERKPSAVAQGRQLKLLESFGLSDAIASIDHSLTNDWTGLFPVKQDLKSTTQSNPNLNSAGFPQPMFKLEDLIK